MASSRRQKTIIFDLSAVLPCSCGKVLGRFDKCCQLHRVLQLAPRCTANQRCIDCFDKDYDTKVNSSISGEWIQKQQKIPQYIRAMYDKEMLRYGISNHWSRNPLPDCKRYLTEPMCLTPRDELLPTVPVAYARHVRGMEPLDIQWTDTASPTTTLNSPALDTAKAVPDIKQEPVDDEEPEGDVTPYMSLPAGAPAWSEFKRGPADRFYYAVDGQRMFMWIYDPTNNSCRRKDLLDDTMRTMGPSGMTLSRRTRTATISRPPPPDSSAMDDDVIVTGCEPAGSVAKWVHETTALTTSTNTAAAQSASGSAAATSIAPTQLTSLKDWSQVDPHQAGDQPGVRDFQFAPGSRGQLAKVARRRPERASSDRSAEGRGKYSTRPGDYKYQEVVPLIWETVYPARSADVPAIVSSEVFGRNPLDVVKPYALFGLPIKDSVRDQIRNTVGALYSLSSGSKEELGTVTLLKDNIVCMAPYTAPQDDYAFASTPYMHCRDTQTAIGAVPDDAVLPIKQSDLTKLHFLQLQLIRVLNFVLTSGDAEHLLRKRATALGQLDASLARILMAREDSIWDVFKCATESFVAVHLWCRDLAIRHADKNFTEMDFKRLRYGPLEHTDMFIHPHIMGSLDQPHEPSVSPTLKNQAQPGVCDDPATSASSPSGPDDTMEEGEVRESTTGTVVSELVSATARDSDAVYAPRLPDTPVVRRRLSRAPAQGSQGAPASPAAMDQE